MGAFDSIKVDADNICNIAIPNHEYQTYNLENQMWVYRITKEGKLVVATTESDFGNECGVIRLRSSLARKSCVLHQINNNKFDGVFSMGGELSENGQWIDYLVLVHNSEIQYVTSYGEVIYSRDPESNGDFQEAIDKACTPDPLSIKQDIMFQQMMSTKHLMPESRSAAASLMTAEDAPKAMERELQARKAKLLKGTDNGKS